MHNLSQLVRLEEDTLKEVESAPEETRRDKALEAAQSVQDSMRMVQVMRARKELSDRSAKSYHKRLTKVGKALRKIYFTTEVKPPEISPTADTYDEYRNG